MTTVVVITYFNTPVYKFKNCTAQCHEILTSQILRYVSDQPQKICRLIKCYKPGRVLYWRVLLNQTIAVYGDH